MICAYLALCFCHVHFPPTFALAAPASYFLERNSLLIEVVWLCEASEKSVSVLSVYVFPHPGAMWKDDGLPAKCRGSSPGETKTFETIDCEAQGGCCSAQVTFFSQGRISSGTHLRT